MKLALFADVHSNFEALTACVNHALALGADRFAFLGDMVGYGADPVAVLEVVEEYAGEGAVTVLGNHDAAVIGRSVFGMNASAQAVIDWTRKQLGPRQLAFLSGLPLAVREDNLFFVHASAVAPEQWIYIAGVADAEKSMNAAAAGIVFCGHVHEQSLYYLGAGSRPMLFRPVSGTPIPTARHRQWLAIVGSAGQPRDHNNAACYALADLERSRLTFFRVPYDFRSAARKIRTAGLPDRLALRLERGT